MGVHLPTLMDDTVEEKTKNLHFLHLTNRSKTLKWRTKVYLK